MLRRAACQPLLTELFVNGLGISQTMWLAHPLWALQQPPAALTPPHSILRSRARDLAAALGKEGLPWGPLGPASTITFPLSPQQLPPASCLHCPATNRQAPDCTSMSPRPCGHITFPEELPSCAWAVTSWRWAFKSRRSATTFGAGVPTLLQEQLSGSPLGWGRGPLRSPKCSFRLQIPRVCVLPLPQVTKRSG